MNKRKMNGQNNYNAGQAEQDFGTQNAGNESMGVKQERSRLEDVKKVFNYLEEHPGVGFIASGALTAGGIGGLVYYHGKMKMAG